ncbi:MAG: O-methyltransferase [Candidatus Lokiarchaeota archaeon]|nr:O-methyltransferase [Candidatus Lokiarchaeota archaeon]
MFHTIPEKIQTRMAFLEESDSNDRINGTPRLERLRQIPPETGKFLYLFLMNTPPGKIIEIGTSAGYSTLWLILACIQKKTKIITFEILEEKIKLARETFHQTETEDYVELIKANALEFIPHYDNITFCFLDAEKRIYQDCYNIIIPKLVKGGIFIADNALSHERDLKPMVDHALNDQRVDALVVPIGKGVLVCRKI